MSETVTPCMVTRESITDAFMAGTPAGATKCNIAFGLYADQVDVRIQVDGGLHYRKVIPLDRLNELSEFVNAVYTKPETLPPAEPIDWKYVELYRGPMTYAQG